MKTNEQSASTARPATNTEKNRLQGPVERDKGKTRVKHAEIEENAIRGLYSRFCEKMAGFAKEELKYGKFEKYDEGKALAETEVAIFTMLAKSPETRPYTILQMIREDLKSEALLTEFLAVSWLWETCFPKLNK